MVGGQLVRAVCPYELPRIFAETSGRSGEDRFRSRPIGDEIEDLVREGALSAAEQCKHQGASRSTKRLHKQSHGEQICRSARTEIARDERLVNAVGVFAPAWATNSARGQKRGCAGLREAQSVNSAPVQQIGVGDICDQRHAGLNPNRFLIPRSDRPRRMQRGKGDVIDGGEATGCFRPGAAGAVAT